MTLIDSLQVGELVYLGELHKARFRCRPGKDRASPWTFECAGSAEDVQSAGSEVPAESVVAVLKTADKRFVGFRSLTADGKVLQTTKEKGLVLRFANYNFETWEQWTLQGDSLSNCLLTNRQYPDKKLPVWITKVTVKTATNESATVAKAPEDQNGHADKHEVHTDATTAALEEQHKADLAKVEADLTRQWESLLDAERLRVADWNAKYDEASRECESLLAEREAALLADRARSERLYEEKSAALAAELEEAKRLRDAALTEVAVMGEELSAAQTALAAAREEMQGEQDAAKAALAADREALVTESKQAAESMAASQLDLEQRRAQWQEAVAKWQADFDEKRAELERGQATLAEVDKSVKASAEALAELERALKGEQERCEERSEAVAQGEKALEASTKRLGQQEADLAEHRESLEADFRSLKEQVKAVEAEQERLKKMESVLKDKEEVLQKEHEEVRGQRRTSEDQVVELEDYKKKLARFREDNLVLRADLESAQRRLKDLEGTSQKALQECRDAAAAECEDLATKLKAAKAKESKLMADVKSSTATASSLASELSGWKERATEMEKEMEAVRRRASDAEALVARLRSDLKMLKSDQTSAEQLAPLKEELDASQAENENLKSENDELKLQLEDKCAELEESLKNVRSANDRQVYLNEQLRLVGSRNAELMAALGAAEARAKHLEAELPEKVRQATHEARTRMERVEKIMAKADMHVAQLQQEKEQLQTALDESRRSSADKEQLQLQLDAATANGKETAEENERLNKWLAEANAHLTAGQKDRAMLAAEKKFMEEEVDRLRHVERSLTKEVADLKNKMQARKAETGRNMPEGESTGETANGAQQNGKRVSYRDVSRPSNDGRVAALGKQLVEAQQRVQTLEAANRSKEDQVRGLTAELHGLQKQLANTLSDHEARIEASEKRSKELVEQLMAANEQLEKEKAALIKGKDVVREDSRSVARMTELEDDNLRLEAQVMELRSQLEELEKQMGGLFAANAPAAASSSATPSPRGSIAETSGLQRLTKAQKQKRRRKSQQAKLAAQADTEGENPAVEDEDQLPHNAAAEGPGITQSSYLAHIRNLAVLSTVSAVSLAVGASTGVVFGCTSS